MIRLICLMLAMLLPLGCGDSRTNLPTERIDTSTPAGQFEWAMQKLKRAVIEFQPSRQDGLQVGKRKVSYELFPPDDVKKDLTARVTIESETVYVHDEPLEEAEEIEERRRKRAREDFRQQVQPDDPFHEENLDPLQQKFLSQMEDLAAKRRTPTVPTPVLDHPEMSVRKVYDLAYLDGSWQLQTKPETDHERLWFEYALKP
jgi:hypothetical protein